MTENPLVCISCNTYNHEKYIADAIEGFLGQKTDFPVEILIHDDASTDGTAAIIRRYQFRYPQIIKPIFQTENQRSKGILVGQFNLARARGEYIALCEGDDYWIDPLKLQKQVEFLRSDTRYSMCFTNFNKVDENGGVLSHGVISDSKKKDLTQSDILINRTPKYLTTLFRRSALDLSIMGARRIRNGDTMLFAAVARYGDAKYLDFISGCYRVHSGGVWSSRSEIERLRIRLDSFRRMRKVLRRENEDRAIKIRIGKILLDLYGLCRKRYSPRIFAIFIFELAHNLYYFKYFLLSSMKKVPRKTVDSESEPGRGFRT